MDLLAQKAIEEAIRGNWKEAVRLNEQIVEEDSKNREALNRLARAYSELGKINKSIASYKKVLRIDPYNSIAQKALTRLKELTNYQISNSNGTNKGDQNSSHIFARNIANLFIEEPGKTKSVTLLHLGAVKLLAILDAGQKVDLVPHLHRVSVMTLSGEYIGRLPDDLASRIIKLTRKGNSYFTYIKSISSDCVKIFIREDKRSPSISDTPSFPLTEKPGYIAFTSPDSIHEEKPDVSTAEEETED